MHKLGISPKNTRYHIAHAIKSTLLLSPQLRYSTYYDLMCTDTHKSINRSTLRGFFNELNYTPLRVDL